MCARFFDKEIEKENKRKEENLMKGVREGVLMWYRRNYKAKTNFVILGKVINID